MPTKISKKDATRILRVTTNVNRLHFPTKCTQPANTMSNEASYLHYDTTFSRWNVNRRVSRHCAMWSVLPSYIHCIHCSGYRSTNSLVFCLPPATTWRQSLVAPLRAHTGQLCGNHNKQCLLVITVTCSIQETPLNESAYMIPWNYVNARRTAAMSLARHSQKTWYIDMACLTIVAINTSYTTCPEFIASPQVSTVYNLSLGAVYNPSPTAAASRPQLPLTTIT